MSIVPDNSSRDSDWIAAVAGELRQPVGLGDGYLNRALADLGTRPVPGERRRWPALAALALAAGLLAVVGLGWLGPDREGGQPVRFSLEAPAHRVALVGDFNDWDPAAQPLRRRDGAWSVTLRLPPGRYRYAFVVDDDLWYNDPGHPVAQDEFGTPTSVITVAN